MSIGTFVLALCGPVFIVMLGVCIWLNTRWGKRWLEED
jgi:hypothetical protein